MSIKISYSSSEKYQLSPRLWFNHYILKLREKRQGSALSFGSAVDEAINELLIAKQRQGETTVNHINDAKNIFENNWEKGNVNGYDVIYSQTDKVRFSKADWDIAVLEKPDINVLSDKFRMSGVKIEKQIDTYIKELQDKRQHYERTQQDPLTIEESNNLKYASWLSLYRKGFMLIDAYVEQVLPKIKEVLAVQEKYFIKNENGELLYGFIDLIAVWEDGRIVVFDNKTSSVKYPDDKARTSGQLATYFEAVFNKYNAEWVGFLVVRKDIRKKKEPRVIVQVQIDKVSDETYDKTFETYDDTLNGIREGIDKEGEYIEEKFPCKYPSCNTEFGPCCYKKFCKSGDMAGLEYTKKVEK